MPDQRAHVPVDPVVGVAAGVAVGPLKVAVVAAVGEVATQTYKGIPPDILSAPQLPKTSGRVSQPKRSLE